MATNSDNAVRSFPAAPPGFEPRTSFDSPSNTEEGIEILREVNSSGLRRTTRKRSRPDFYGSSRWTSAKTSTHAALETCNEVHPLELGVDSSQSQILTGPTGAEPSATETRNGNQSSTMPLRSLQEQNTKENSTPKTNRQVDERGSRMNSSPSTHHQEKQNPNMKDNIERVGNVGVNDQLSQGIDPEILQHVTSAVEYMTGNQTDTKEKSMSSNINENLSDMLKAIYRKHGDIAQKCSFESDSMKTLVLLGICKLVQDLRMKQIKDIDVNSLDSYYKTVRDAEIVKVNMQWLRNRLDEINGAVAETKDLVNEKCRRLEDIDSKTQKLILCEVELERLKSEIRDIEDQLVQEVATVEVLNEKISAKFSQFPHANLMDGLI